VVLLPYGPLRGIGAGSRVVALGHASRIAVGPQLLGRVIDGFGEPLDGRAPPLARHWAELHSPASNPMERPRIARVLETGVRAIDVFLTWGRGSAPASSRAAASARAACSG
jgi:flagellum-specific ATP synthase